MAPKHTPGPWKFSETADYRIEDSTGLEICVYFVSEATEAQDLANARLIAAAPELLEVCRMISADGAEDTDPAHISRVVIKVQTLMAARRAIAKAEGRD